MKFLRIEDYKTSQIILIIVLIILIFPTLLTLPSISKFLDFTNTGEIGDTIGGITAPLINGLAAILVFIAFKAQIKANEIFVNQEKSRTILEQITLIQEDKLEIEKLIKALSDSSSNLSYPVNFNFLNLINKVIYFISEMHLAYELIEEYKGERHYLYKKLFYLYTIRYKDIISELNTNLNNSLSSIQPDYEKYIAELLFEIKFLNESLVDLNKFKTEKN